MVRELDLLTRSDWERDHVEGGGLPIRAATGLVLPLHGFEMDVWWTWSPSRLFAWMCTALFGSAVRFMLGLRHSADEEKEDTFFTNTTAARFSPRHIVLGKHNYNSELSTGKRLIVSSNHVQRQQDFDTAFCRSWGLAVLQYLRNQRLPSVWRSKVILRLATCFCLEATSGGRYS